MMKSKRATLAFLGVLSVGACSTDFEPFSRLTKLRVLALRAEPVNPAMGETTMLSPLVFAPATEPAPPVSFAWSWCPLLGSANQGYACPVTDAQVQMIGAALGLSQPLPPLVLGTAETQSFANPFPAAALAKVCAEGALGLRPDCEGGFPIRFLVTVTRAAEVQTATVTVRLPIAAGVPSNVNPRFESMPASPIGVVVGGVEQPVDDRAAPVLPRLRETELRAHVTDAEAESYLGKDDNGQPAMVRERLTLSWFSETGDFESDRTGYFPGKTELGQFLTNKLKPQKKADYAPDRTRVIVVLRDSRGGVNWAQGAVGLEATP
jgi:hypothetical protein